MGKKKKSSLGEKIDHLLHPEHAEHQDEMTEGEEADTAPEEASDGEAMPQAETSAPVGDNVPGKFRKFPR